MTKITEETRAQIVQLREGGATYKSIAEQLDISQSSAARVYSLPRDEPVSKPSKTGKACQQATPTIVGSSEKSSAYLVKAPYGGAVSLRIETTDNGLASYLKACGRDAVYKDKLWTYEEDARQILYEIPGLRCWFSSWDVPDDLYPSFYSG